MERLSAAGAQLAARKAPWEQVWTPAAWSAPASWAEASARVTQNCGRFGANYVLIAAGLAAVNLLLHPLALRLCAVAGSAHVAAARVRGRALAEHEAVAAACLLVCALLLLTDAPALLAEALVGGALGALCHALLRVPDEYMDSST
jgi:hypothetical protein